MSTLTLEVLAPFTVQQNGRVTTWEPGQRIAMSPETAQRVIERVGHKVRVLESTNRINGDLLRRIVTWDSPLFGVLSATVHEDLPHGVRVVHPLTEVACVIPTTWLRFTAFTPSRREIKE